MKRISAEVIAAIFDKSADDMVHNRRWRGQATTTFDKYELSINLKTACSFRRRGDRVDALMSAFDT